ncbi:DNA helicase-2/ATP-dependent DNA helicase PcrA [Bradyrhizobium sp. CIR48]|uniref:UvrD-helicase domain-containing protein n=1 Tax=Bradyrhizobium sp. CIR48 TaxID=2663840 RepID=UPI0017973B38|nr:UvrD-helicase domain-containing protein [Bradyrhizobium sp. CIR48]MBB4427865.1 DNA helicase-2/ATP-dependent DNA helicase PcrA [Bradyrhizobium sp. CIR48]
MADINLLDIKRGTVTAPAGCGKTHLIAQAITKETPEKPILVLTHTNAGVAALRGRLEKAGVPSKSYRLSTIDGWAMRLISTFPKRSNADPKILKLENPKTDYPEIRGAAARMLKAGHGLDVLASTYSRLFVDEYQDCNVPQHAIVYFMAPAFPTCVLGDPMQAIFDFQGKLADWDEHVCKHFPLAGELTIPWRWKNVGEEKFGRWLLDVRKELFEGTPIELKSLHANASWIDTSGKDAFERRLSACQTKAPNANGSVLIIGDSTSPQMQRQFASRTPGATAVESVDLRDLVSFARNLDLKSTKALDQVVSFAEDVMTSVGGATLLKRVESLKAARNRKPASDLEGSAIRFADRPSHAGVRELLGAMGEQPGVRSHRPGILRGCIRALQMAEADGGPSFHEAAVTVREQSRALGRPLPKRAVGSTLLLKGLEADVSVILDADDLNRRNLYVAMTRGSRRLVVCASKSVLKPA